MAAHRYWRLDLPPQSISNGTQLSEVQVRTSIGGADIGAAAARTGPFGALADLFDGSNSTEVYAYAGGNAALSLWIAFDFGSPVEIVEVLVRSGTSGGLAPYCLRVRYSDDGAQWAWTAPTFFLAEMGPSATFLASGFAPSDLAGGLSGRALRWSPGVQAAQRRVRVLPLMRHDAVDGGDLRVAGTVMIDGTPAAPASRRVRLFDKISGRLVREMWSAADGTFEFAQVRRGPWLVVVDDHTLTYEADAATEVLAVL